MGVDLEAAADASPPVVLLYAQRRWAVCQAGCTRAGRRGAARRLATPWKPCEKPPPKNFPNDAKTAPRYFLEKTLTRLELGQS